LFGKKYKDEKKNFRVISDHLRASQALIDNGVIPSNKMHGYILRRLIRRIAIKTDQVIKITDNKIIVDEVKKFKVGLDNGLKEIKKIENITGKLAFDLYQSFGFPVELTIELFADKGQKVDLEEFKKEFEKHKELSRTASAGMFKGGLGEQSEIATKYHTATHLLHASLRQVLGEKVQQKGSNITSERLRFDFSYSEKLSAKQIREIEDLINQKIRENLPVTSEVMDKNSALQNGALGFFSEKYGDRVTVYTISNFSKEICGGPHVKNTGNLGTFKIIKEESVGLNLRRIYALLEPIT